MFVEVFVLFVAFSFSSACELSWESQANNVVNLVDNDPNVYDGVNGSYAMKYNSYYYAVVSSTSGDLNATACK